MGGGAVFGNERLFLYDGTQGTFQQITNEFNSEVGAINEEGTCVTLVSREDFTGQNPLNNEQLFIYDIASGEYTQVGNNMTTSGIRTPTPSADCSTIAFTSIGSFTEPERMNEEQVYLARCFIRQVPTLSEWGLIALAAVLGIVGFMVIRRRQVTA